MINKSFYLYGVIMEHSKWIIKTTCYFMEQFKLQQLTGNILKHMYK